MHIETLTTSWTMINNIIDLADILQNIGKILGAVPTLLYVVIIFVVSIFAIHECVKLHQFRNFSRTNFNILGKEYSKILDDVLTFQKKAETTFRLKS